MSIFTSSKKQSSDNDLTINLSDFVDIALRCSDPEPVPIPPYIGEIIELKNKKLKTPILHVEWRTDSKLPFLWRYHIWADSVRRFTLARERSERERRERFILEANVKLIAKGLQQHPYLMIERWAISTASYLMKHKRNNAIREIGIEKLIERIEEIP